MKTRMIVAVVGMVMLLWSSCSTLPYGFEKTETGGYLHALSGVEFVLSVDSFSISTVKSNDPWGMDVSVTYSVYTPARAHVIITLYPVGTAMDNLETEFLRTCLEISKRHPHAFKYDVPHGSTSASLHGNLFMAAFSYIQSVGGNSRGVIHIASLYEHKQWYIKYEYIIPGKQEELSEAGDFEDFLERLYTLPFVEPRIEPPIVE